MIPHPYNTINTKILEELGLKIHKKVSEKLKQKWKTMHGKHLESKEQITVENGRKCPALQK